MNVRALIWTGVFISTILGANWALTTWGFVPIWFGLTAPAGVYFAGLAFTCRDMLRESTGRTWVVLAIILGAGFSYLLEDAQRIAMASGTAFLVSELADAAVYEPLRKRGWIRAVLASNVVGFTLDSVLFLWLAFGSLAFIEGQLIGKGYMTLGAIALLAAWRQYRKVAA